MCNIYIAGAHSRGATMGHYLQYLNPSLKILAYLYDDDEDNPLFINEVPVIKIGNDSKLDKNCTVYVCTRYVNQQHLKETLMNCGIKNIILVDYKLDLIIRNEYLKKYFNSIGFEYVKIDELDLHKENYIKSNSIGNIYVINSVFDKELKDEYQLAEYEKLIQVGTSLTDKRLKVMYFDNKGDNISGKNKQFCELTGLYWIWKNIFDDYIGVAHYRRHFILPDDWKARMEYYNIDVILPTPLYVNPNLEENFKSRHMSIVWDIMLECFGKRYPQEYEDAYLYFKSNSLYSPCNMFIMKKEALNDLCSWLFPILFDVVKTIGNIKDVYQNRYPGFISERLITYFFAKKQNRYKLVYADKNFLL